MKRQGWRKTVTKDAARQSKSSQLGLINAVSSLLVVWLAIFAYPALSWGGTEYHCSVGASGNLRAVSADLGTRLSLLRAGQSLSVPDIRVTNKNYEIKSSGTRDKPITVKFGSAAILINTYLKISGDWVRVIGGDWRNSHVEVTGSYNRVSRLRFSRGQKASSKDRLNSAVMISGPASHNRVDHCSVRDWKKRGMRHHLRKVAGSKGNVFDHNLMIYNGMTGVNGTEAFQVGVAHEDPKFSPGTIIEYNWVERFSLESEWVSLKSNENIVRYNVAIDGKSAIVARTSSRSQIYGNRLIRTTGIRIHGDDNRIYGNRLEGGFIDLYSGDCLASELEKNGERTKFIGCHPAARNTQIGPNVLKNASVRVGRKGTGKKMYYDRQWFKAENTMISQKVGGVKTMGRVGKISPLSFSVRAFKNVTLAKKDVGPGVDDRFCKGTSPVVDPPKDYGVRGILGQIDKVEKELDRLRGMIKNAK